MSRLADCINKSNFAEEFKNFDGDAVSFIQSKRTEFTEEFNQFLESIEESPQEFVTETSKTESPQSQEIIVEGENVGFYYQDKAYINKDLYQTPTPLKQEYIDLQELKNQIARESNSIERDGIVEPETLEKITITKKFFGAPSSTPSIAPSIQSRAQLYENPIQNVEYLQTTFIADFNKESIKAKRDNPKKYKDYYSKFEISEKGITFTSSDPLTIKLTEPFHSENMENYLKMTDQIPTEEYEGIVTRDIKRTYYLENPKSLPIFAKDYTKIDDQTIMSKESTDFIRTPDNRTYEQTASVGAYTFYSQITPADNILALNTTQPELNIDLEDYKYLEQGSPDTSITNLFTKSVEEEIDKELECK